MKNFLILRKQFFTVFLLLAIFFVACTKKKEAEVWYCPMHTHYQSDHAGKCPICGMNLVKKENTDITGNKEEQKDEHKSHAEQATPTENSITVSADAQQRAGIVTTRPSKRQLSMTLTLAGEVAYEPDIYAATIEYRQLVAAGQTLDASMGGFNLTQSALLRLRQMGLSKDEIHQYAHSNTAASRLITGTGAGYALITLRLAETDLAFIKKGMPVKITSAAYAGKIWQGKVTAVGSLVDAKNRSVSARALVKDNGALASQMAVTAQIAIRAGNGVSVERSAVFDTGARQVVFVKTSPTTFVPHVVRVVGGNDEYALVSGIDAKNEVALTGAFLLDSEAKLKWGDTLPQNLKPAAYGHNGHK